MYYSSNAGELLLKAEPSLVSHIKARRQKEGDIIKLSNFDGYLYEYEITSFNRNKIELKCLNKQDFIRQKSGTKLALAMIDIDSIFEIAPYLNELGLDELILVYTQYSQKSFKFDEKRLNKLEIILKNSSAQCKRADILKLSIYKNLDELAKKMDFVMIDFCDEKISEFSKETLYLIGPEGGFSEEERQKYPKKGLNNNNILKAKTAAISIVSKILI